MLQAGSLSEVLRLALVWLLVMLAGSLACYLVAHSAVSADRPAAAPAETADER